ncbi:MAG: LexA family transcriptional regulator [Halomonadaceae bacterium]|nr:MAG: LexA family transcriptional regulator [Halomonadaceae bacterium]
MDTIGSRIRYARQQAGLTQPELAGRCGWSGQSRVSNYEREIREPRSSDVKHLANALGVSEAWLWTGEDVNYVQQPKPPAPWQLQEGIAATPGEDNDIFLPCLDPLSPHITLRFSQHLLRRANVQAANASFTTLSDQQMHPVLPQGAVVAFDRSVTEITDGDIFVVDHGGLLKVCYLFQQQEDTLILGYANPQFPQEHQPRELRIIGRVFWWSVLC